MNKTPRNEAAPETTAPLTPYPRLTSQPVPRAWSERLPWLLFPYLSSGSLVIVSFIKGNYLRDEVRLVVLCIALFLVACLTLLNTLGSLIKRAIRGSIDSFSIANTILSFFLMLLALPLWILIIIGD